MTTPTEPMARPTIADTPGGAPPPPPRRLRDQEREREESRRKIRRWGARSTYLLILWLTIPVLLLLGYGLLRQTLLAPPVDATIDRSDLLVKAGERIQIDIVNACGADGMARRFTEFMRARRFDVAETSTSEQRSPASRVVDRVGDLRSARKVAYALGIPEERIETEIDSSLFLRATVIIGEDFRSLRPMK